MTLELVEREPVRLYSALSSGARAMLRRREQRQAAGGLRLSQGLDLGAQASAGSVNFASVFPGTLRFSVQADRGVASTGGVVTSVIDQANGIVFTPNSASQRPLVGAGYNGHASLLFDGVDDNLVAAITVAAPGTQPYYTYGIFKPTNKAGQGNFYGSSSGVGVLYAPNGNVLTTGIRQYGSNSGTMSQALTRIYCGYTNSTADQLRIASAVYTGSLANNAAGTDFLIGSGTTAGSSAGLMDFVLIALGLGALNTTQMASVDAQAYAYWSSAAGGPLLV